MYYLLLLLGLLAILAAQVVNYRSSSNLIIVLSLCSIVGLVVEFFKKEPINVINHKTLFLIVSVILGFFVGFVVSGTLAATCLSCLILYLSNRAGFNFTASSILIVATIPWVIFYLIIGTSLRVF